MELVVHCHNLWVFSVKAIKDHSFLVNSRGDELVVERSRVHVVVMVLIVPIVMLQIVSEAIWSERGWTVATSTSHCCHAALD